MAWVVSRCLVVLLKQDEFFLAYERSPCLPNLVVEVVEETGSGRVEAE
jgi:hypothetical protein